MQRARLVRRALILAVVVLALFGASVRTAGASLDGCPSAPLAHPFLPWLDPAAYTPAPNGDLESGGAGWTLGGGAAVVPGNETFDVGSAADASSLALPNGSSATTGAMCVGLLSPTMRFFAVNKGSLLSTLRVDVVYTDPAGDTHAQTIGLVLGTGTWQPTLPMLVLANVTALPLDTDGRVSVAFRFTPQGALGNWRIDDVYVDPLKGS